MSQQDVDKALGSMVTSTSMRPVAASRLRERQQQSRPTAQKPTKASFSGAPGTFNPFGKSVECPHCGEGLSRGYVIKALLLLAKSEGLDLSAELEALLPKMDSDTEKAVSGSTNYVGNKVASHRGQAPGAMHSSSRGGGKHGVDRTQRPTNPVTEKGMAKSLFPVIEGQPQIVEYSYGTDSLVAEQLAKGMLGQYSQPNLRTEREAFTGEPTVE